MNEDFDIRNESVTPAEKEFEKALRPLKFSDFSGQSGVVEYVVQQCTGYRFGYELLMLNGLITFAGLQLCLRRRCG